MKTDTQLHHPDRSAEPAAPALLAQRFTEVRATTERLCVGLTPEDCAVQSMNEASPISWHLAHTSWFFETFVLQTALAGYRVFDERFAYLFNSYYNAVGERVARSKRGLLTRPGLEQVRHYREHVDRNVRELLEQAGARDRQRIVEVVTLGLNHEQQHQELMLTDLKHLFASNPLLPAYVQHARRDVLERSESPRFAHYEEGLHWIGHEGSGFAFDNEGPRHRVFIDAFELALRPVTNGEYLAFIADRGYERPELWLSDGWDAVTQHGWRAPLYWQQDGARWSSFTLSGLRTLAPEEPVAHVSYYEADAYARWAGARLPRECEWELAARDLPVEGNFVESGRLHPSAASPVRARDASQPGSARRPAALFGDVWEWTQSAYSAYPGYRAQAGALGEYNGKFMCNQMVLRGGSCVSPQSHLRSTYRNFFAPATRWQFSGIRLAR